MRSLVTKVRVCWGGVGGCQVLLLPNLRVRHQRSLDQSRYQSRNQWSRDEKSRDWVVEAVTVPGHCGGGWAYKDEGWNMVGRAREDARASGERMCGKGEREGHGTRSREGCAGKA